MLQRRGAATALGLVVLLASAGCAASPDAPPSTMPASDADAVLEIVQLRGDVASGHIELRVTNEGAAALEVARAAYESNRWSARMERAEGDAVPAGASRNLRLQLPPPTCDEGPLEHRAVLELADGRVVAGVPGDPLGQLEAIDDAACALRSFERDVAAVRWLDPAIPADGSGAAIVRLEVVPVAGEGAAGGSVDEVGATVLLAPVDASGNRIESLPVGLAIEPGGEPAVVEVPLTPGRCDAHAIAEDKQGTLFRIRVTSAGEPAELVLPSPNPQRDALLAWVVARCAALP
ncbi:hypothetical protein [Agrococcus sp. TSP3-2-1]|uniref:hypothetical protein n=1 Tax=Agrococcus sp. TSP3-2-1 TaxID=2804583 RepID=UPI003CF48740